MCCFCLYKVNELQQELHVKQSEWNTQENEHLEKIASLKLEYEKCAGQLQKSNEHGNKMESENSRLRQELEELLTLCENYQRQKIKLDKTERDLSKFNDDIAIKNLTISDLEIKLAETERSNKHNANLSAEKDQLSREFQSLRMRIQEDSEHGGKKLNEASRTMDSLLVKMTALEKMTVRQLAIIVEKDKQITDLQEEQEMLTQGNQTLRMEITKRVNEQQMAENEFVNTESDLNDEISRQKETAQKMARDASNQSNILLAVRQESVRYADQYETEKKTRVTSDNECQSLKRDVMRLSEKLKTFEDTGVDVTKQDELREEGDRHSRVNQDLKQENEKLRLRLDVLQSDAMKFNTAQNVKVEELKMVAPPLGSADRLPNVSDLEEQVCLLNFREKKFKNFEVIFTLFKISIIINEV